MAVLFPRERVAAAKIGKCLFRLVNSFNKKPTGAWYEMPNVSYRDNLKKITTWFHVELYHLHTVVYGATLLLKIQGSYALKDYHNLWLPLASFCNHGTTMYDLNAPSIIKLYEFWGSFVTVPRSIYGRHIMCPICTSQIYLVDVFLR